jgi:hypothetical protein
VKSFLAILVASAALAFAMDSASAEQQSAASKADGTKSSLLCTPGSSEFQISVPGIAPSHAYANKQMFDASVLITYNSERRTGTRRKHFQCGAVSIDVRGGYYNANPQGELGAADDFAKLTISMGTNRLETSLVEDACADASAPRAQAAWGRNPVQAVEGHVDAATGAYQLTLFKTKCDDTGTGKPLSEVINWR